MPPALSKETSIKFDQRIHGPMRINVFLTLFRQYFVPESAARSRAVLTPELFHTGESDLRRLSERARITHCERL